MMHGRPDVKEEALGLLQEECSEVIKEASKIFRSGPEFARGDRTKTNLERLHEEIADVLICIMIAEEVGAIDMKSFDLLVYLESKKPRIREFTSIPEHVIANLGN